MLFHPAAGSGNADDVGFREDKQGSITFLFQGEFAYEKLPWWQTAKVQLVLGAGLLGIFLIVCVGQLMRYVYKRWRKIPEVNSPPLARTTARLVWILGLLNLVFVIGTISKLSTIGPSGLGDKVPTLIQWLLVIPLVTTALTLVLVVLNFLAWKNAWWSFRIRALHSVYVFAAIAFVFYLNYWNMLGFHY